MPACLPHCGKSRPLKRGCGLEARPHKAEMSACLRMAVQGLGSMRSRLGSGRLGEVDPSNGYEEIAGQFMAARNGRVGRATVREWGRTLPAGSSILDLGCGHGVPISQTLIEDGFAVYGVDASTQMIAAFRERFPGARAECSTVEDSTFFGRKFDGVIAWGLMFLLPVESQAAVIKKVAGALNSGRDVSFYSAGTGCRLEGFADGARIGFARATGIPATFERRGPGVGGSGDRRRGQLLLRLQEPGRVAVPQPRLTTQDIQACLQ
jgi:SAM-dependent methyltransferase